MSGRLRGLLVVVACLAVSPLARAQTEEAPIEATPPTEEAPPTEESPPIDEAPSIEVPAQVTEEPPPAPPAPLAPPAPAETPPPLDLSPADALPSPVPPPPPPEPEPEAPEAPLQFDGRAYPARYGLRPLTLGEGVLRIDTGSSARFQSGITPVLTFGLRLGITANLEAGISWSLLRDPIFHATYRFDVDPDVDIGIRASVRVPAVTTGNTVVRIGVPLVIRGGGWFRLQTGVDLDLLFAANVSPLFEIPLQLAFSPTDGFAFGFEGWLGILNGTEVHGRVGTFVNPIGRTPVRALWDVRIALAYLIGERAVEVSTAVSFYPQLW